MPEPATGDRGSPAARVTDDEREGLREIARRRRFLFATFAALPVFLVVYYAGWWSVPTKQFILLAWVAVYAVAALVYLAARCPRCNRLFHSAYALHNPLARTCRHCGLSLNPDQR